MKIVLCLSGAMAAALLIACLSLALLHPKNTSNELSTNDAIEGIRLLIPTNPWSFAKIEVHRTLLCKQILRNVSKVINHLDLYVFY